MGRSVGRGARGRRRAGGRARGPGRLSQAATFGTAGARAGIDVWLGRAAVTVAVAYDYLPIGPTVSFVLGGSFVVF